MFQIKSTDDNTIDGENVLRLRILGKILIINVAKLITPSKNTWFLTRRIEKTLELVRRLLFNGIILSAMIFVMMDPQ